MLGCVLTLAVLVVTISVLEENRFWPFATGTSNPAFLGTTFGMSPQEVGRILSKEGTRLLTYEEFKRVDALHQIGVFDFLYASKEEEKLYSDLCMPSITMFGTEVEAKFTFRQQRLESVTVYFGCYDVTNALNLVESVKSHLLRTFTLSGREDSQYVAGAFNLNYASTNSTASLWVNLADPKKLIVNLTLVDSRGQAERKKQLKEREKRAFSPAP